MSESHVFTVASGFGLRLVPRSAPYRFTLSPVPRGIDVERAVAGRWLFARVVPEQGGGLRSELDERTTSISDLVEVRPGPDWSQWWAETSWFRLPLLPGWTLQAGGEPNAPFVFDLLGPQGMLIYLQTPEAPPVPTEMAAPGQQVVASGEGPRSRWVELRYVYGGEPWAQRHDLVRVGSRHVVVTAQSHVTRMTVALGAQEALVAAMVPTGEA